MPPHLTQLVLLHYLANGETRKLYFHPALLEFNQLLLDFFYLFKLTTHTHAAV